MGTSQDSPRTVGRRLAVESSRRLAGLRADYTFVATDAALMVVAWLLVRVLTAENFTRDPAGTWRVLLLAPALQLVCNAAFGLYGLVWRQAGIDEARRLIGSGVAVMLLGSLVAVTFDTVPWSLVTLGPVLATFLTGLSRFRSRLFAWQRRRPAGEGQRLIVIGAGHTGANLVRDLLSNPHLGALPVAFADDDRRLVGRSVSGVPVISTLAQLAEAARGRGADQLVLAVPSADGNLVQRTADAARALGVPFKVVPAAHEWVTGRAAVQQVRKPRIEDLLGRAQVETDLEGVRRAIEGRTVLLTGSGGSIGSEIARQLSQFQPRMLVMLDHDETHLFDARMSIAPDDRSRCVDVLADIRDGELMVEVFRRFTPDIVFHAAAHKHVPILEQYPIEGIKTNVLGTKNLLDAAEAIDGVDRFVLISTDKAVSPENVLGATKRLAEQLVGAQTTRQGRYCAVRFGNVLGSRGSVVPTFQRQIDAGGPITLTDPEMTRYFMSTVEAVQLVLQAAVLTSDNDLFLLEMGTPVKILDLARLMTRLSGFTEREVPIVITGARAGEKQSELLHDANERVLPTSHSCIERLISPSLPRDELDLMIDTLRTMTEQPSAEGVRETLLEMVRAADARHAETTGSRHASGVRIPAQSTGPADRSVVSEGVTWKT